MSLHASEARYHQPPAIAESQTSSGISFPCNSPVSIPASKRTLAIPSNARRMESASAEGASGAFQNSPSAFHSWASIFFRWMEDKLGTGHSFTHLTGLGCGGLARDAILYGSNAAGCWPAASERRFLVGVLDNYGRLGPVVLPLGILLLAGRDARIHEMQAKTGAAWSSAVSTRFLQICLSFHSMNVIALIAPRPKVFCNRGRCETYSSTRRPDSYR